MLEHSISFVKSKNIWIISSIFFDYNAVKLEKNKKKNQTRKKHKHVKTKQMLLNIQWIAKEIKAEKKHYLERNERKTWWSKIYGIQLKSVLWQTFIAIQAYLRKEGKHQIIPLSLHLKELDSWSVEYKLIK